MLTSISSRITGGSRAAAHNLSTELTHGSRSWTTAPRKAELLQRGTSSRNLLIWKTCGRYIFPMRVGRRITCRRNSLRIRGDRMLETILSSQPIPMAVSMYSTHVLKNPSTIRRTESRHGKVHPEGRRCFVIIEFVFAGLASRFTPVLRFSRKWWNWQTHHLEGVAPKGMGVQVPPSAP